MAKQANGQTIIIQEKRSGCGCGTVAFLGLCAIGLIICAMIYGWGKMELNEIDKRIEFDKLPPANPRAPAAQQSASDAAKPTILPPRWKFNKVIDEMTDAVVFVFETEGTRVGDGLIEYCPRLRFTFKPQTVKQSTRSVIGKFETMIVIESDGLPRTGGDLLLRFDADEAQPWHFTPSTDRHAAFIDDAKRFGALFDKANKLTVRYTSTLNATRTSSFTLENVDRQKFINVAFSELLRKHPRSVTFEE